MAEPYTPTVEEARTLFVENLPGASDDWTGALAMFDRMIDAVEAKARAEVIDWFAQWEVFSPATIRLAREHLGVDASIRSGSEEDR